MLKVKWNPLQLSRENAISLQELPISLVPAIEHPLQRSQLCRQYFPDLLYYSPKRKKTIQLMNDPKPIIKL